jgi:hypothetical protein
MRSKGTPLSSNRPHLWRQPKLQNRDAVGGSDAPSDEPDQVREAHAHELNTSNVRR